MARLVLGGNHDICTQMVREKLAPLANRERPFASLVRDISATLPSRDLGFLGPVQVVRRDLTLHLKTAAADVVDETEVTMERPAIFTSVFDGRGKEHIVGEIIEGGQEPVLSLQQPPA